MRVQLWQPANLVEQQMLEAFAAGNADAAALLLRGARLAMPVTAAAAAGTEAPLWPTVSASGRTWIVIYTSVESMRLGTNDAFEHALPCSLAGLAAAWPDPEHQWALAINPGLPIELTLGAGAVARLAAPSLLEERDAEPGSRTPMMQKLLRHSDVHDTLASNATRVSGYCHQVADVIDIDAPDILVRALGRKDEMADLISDQGSVNVLRWPAVGLELYRNAFGGLDEASRAAVDGWLIEEPPFVGLGFAPSADHLIREYKVDGVGLPNGAQICELTSTGDTHIRALLDIDGGQWLLIVPEPEGDDGS
jgi:hypothetical protein